MGYTSKIRKLLSWEGPSLVVVLLNQYWHRESVVYLGGLDLDNECVGDFMPHDIYWAHRGIYDLPFSSCRMGKA